MYMVNSAATVIVHKFTTGLWNHSGTDVLTCYDKCDQAKIIFYKIFTIKIMCLYETHLPTWLESYGGKKIDEIYLCY